MTFENYILDAIYLIVTKINVGELIPLTQKQWIDIKPMPVHLGGGNTAHVHCSHANHEVRTTSAVSTVSVCMWNGAKENGDTQC